jgi:hypothetical protein
MVPIIRSIDNHREFIMAILPANALVENRTSIAILTNSKLNCKRQLSLYECLKFWIFWPDICILNLQKEADPMAEPSKNRSMFKVLFGIVAALAAILIGKKVVKEVKKRRTQEEY